MLGVLGSLNTQPPPLFTSTPVMLPTQASRSTLAPPHPSLAQGPASDKSPLELGLPPLADRTLPASPLPTREGS